MHLSNTFGLHLLGVRKGDEVITIPNSFIASVSAIVHLGAKPVFVDVLPDQTMDPNLLEKVITKKTKAIMPVHLTGRVSEMKEINRIAKKYTIYLNDVVQTPYINKDIFSSWAQYSILLPSSHLLPGLF